MKKRTAREVADMIDAMPRKELAGLLKRMQWQEARASCTLDGETRRLTPATPPE